MSHTVLVVDDEVDLVNTLRFNLEREGYACRVAGSGEEALKAATLEPLPSVILLDLMLPGISGVEVCKQLRSESATRDIPIIMLTAKSDEIDRVVGLEVGADDYVAKPFSVRELLLRVRAVLRRTSPPETSRGAQRFGVLSLDTEGHKVWVGDTEVALTALEFRLLHTLMSRRGRVLSRDALLEDVWQMSGDVTTRTVDTHVKRLRHKLAEAGSYIETVRGVGYRFRSRPEESD